MILRTHQRVTVHHARFGRPIFYTFARVDHDALPYCSVNRMTRRLAVWLAILARSSKQGHKLLFFMAFPFSQVILLLFGAWLWLEKTIQPKIQPKKMTVGEWHLSAAYQNQASLTLIFLLSFEMLLHYYSCSSLFSFFLGIHKLILIFKKVPRKELEEKRFKRDWELGCVTAGLLFLLL